MAEIEFRDVYKRYADGFEAVKRFSLDIRDGDLMVLVGPSGSGKSSALRMVAGLEDVSQGDVKIGGRVVNDVAPKNRNVAMVFQDYALYPHMTVRENMGFALRLARAPRVEINQKVKRLRSCSSSKRTSNVGPQTCRAASVSGSRSGARSSGALPPS